MSQVAPAPRRSPFAAFFVGLWDVANFTRKLVLNLIFFGLLFLVFIFFIIAAGSGGVKPLMERTTFVLAPEGRLVEQFTADPATRALAKALGDKSAEEVQLRDLLRAIEAAQKDEKIERMLLRVDQLQPTGYASLREVAAALAKFRASGKQIVAFGENLSQTQYLLAAQADEVYLDPMGSLMLEGLGRYRQYYREGLQDKLGVDVHLFKVGEYKSAAEPYVLDAASKEAKEADLYWMNDVWQRLLADIAKVRKTTPEALAAGIDTLPEGIAAAGGDLAKYALQQKLVDGLKTQEEVEDLLIERGVADEDSDTGFRAIGLTGYLTQLDAKINPLDKRPQVAVVVAEGEITDGDQPAGRVGGLSTSALLREARDDDDVKAVVLRVDSPGGGVYASEQIRREVAALKKAGKPVVVSMGDLAASGGYWISMNADRIYADASTITGSIGIFGLFPTVDRTLGKLGVHTDGVATAKYAGAFDITRPLDPGVATTVQAVIEKGYRDFTGKVAKARGKTVEQIDAVAQGRVWSGAQAQQRGLVDALGGLGDAVADAAARAKLGKPDRWQTVYVEERTVPLSQMLSELMQSRAGLGLLRGTGLGELLLASRAHEQAPLRFVQAALEQRGQARVKALAYCFCEPM